VAIEKAFAIEAEPARVWEALWSEAADDGERIQLEGFNWPHSLTVRVDLGGIPALITYRLLPREGHTEVVATLEPLGVRYVLLQVLSLGRMRVGFEMLIVQWLANLKAAVEARPEADTAGDD
jgi:hypothetical protein